MNPSTQQPLTYFLGAPPATSPAAYSPGRVVLRCLVYPIAALGMSTDNIGATGSDFNAFRMVIDVVSSPLQNKGW